MNGEEPIMRTVGHLRGLYTAEEAAQVQSENKGEEAMPEVTVHLIQCLCPGRHCILAAAFEEPPGSTAEATALLKASMEAMIAARTIDPWCGLCHAERDSWTFEVRSLPGKTMAELMPLLRQSEAAQRMTAAIARQEQAEARASRN